MRLTVIEDNSEVDLAPFYFNFQINGISEKERTITVNAFVFDSPGLPPSHTERNSVRDVSSENYQAASQDSRKAQIIPRATRSLTLTEEQDDILFDKNDSDSDSSFPVNPPKDRRILLPLERYAKKQQQTASNIERSLQVKRQELAEFREQLKIASK